MRARLFSWTMALMLVCVGMNMTSCRPKLGTVMLRLSDDVTGTWEMTDEDGRAVFLLVFEKNGKGHYKVRQGKGDMWDITFFKYSYDHNASLLYLTFDQSKRTASVLNLTTLSLVLQGWPDKSKWTFAKLNQ